MCAGVKRLSRKQKGNIYIYLGGLCEECHFLELL
jgi:hypothetical protein